MPPVGVPTVYVIVRRDIPLPAQVAQVGHVCLVCASVWPEARDAHIVVTTVPDLASLSKAYDTLEERGVPFAYFIEPDLGDELTAIASKPVEGAEKGSFRRYPLWAA